MMKRFSKLTKIMLTILSMYSISTVAFGIDNYSKISYLDDISASGDYEVGSSASSILNMNSPEARTIEAKIELSALQQNTTITNVNEKVNLSLMNANLSQVLRMLCDKAKIGFIPMAQSVEQKRISLDLNNVKLNDAFLLISKLSNIEFVLENNTLLAYDKNDKERYTQKKSTNITVLPVKYANVKYVSSFLNTNLFGGEVEGLSDHAVVSANPTRNEIFVFGTDDDLATIKKILPLIDTKPLVNSFKVNHTTPKEMAQLVCESLFNAKFDDKDSTTKDDEKITIGGSTAACRIDKRSSGDEQDDKSENLVPFAGPPLTISYFSESGKIGVYGGSVQQAELIRDFIKEHDKKQLMAYVEISVISV